MRVLVTGGTGVVGIPAVDHLLERGHQVRLLSRNAADDAGRWARGVEPLPASVGDPESVRGAAEGCDAVLHIAGIVAENPPEATFEAVNVEGTRHLLEEAARAGVRRFVYVSSLGAERGESDYHRSKHAAERLVEGFPGEWLIVRPGNVYGPGDEVVSLFLKMVRTLPVVPLVGDGEQRFQPVWAGDAGRALAAAVERGGDVSRRALDLAGPDLVSVNQLLDALEEITGKDPQRIPVPELLARTGTGVAEALGIDLPVKTDQLTMLEEENVILPGRENALDVLGVEPTPLREGLRLLADALPERLPDDGTGPLRRHRFWADIRGSRQSGAELIRMLRRDFRQLADPTFMRVGVEPDSEAELDPGETLTLAIPFRGNVQVRVEEVQPLAVSAMTLEGHPLSGAVRFLAEDLAGAVRFEVRTYTRASSLVDLLAMSTVGEPFKDIAWRNLVSSVVERSGGEAEEGVQMEVDALDEEEAAGVEEWAGALVHRRERGEAPDPEG